MTTQFFTRSLIVLALFSPFAQAAEDGGLFVEPGVTYSNLDSTIHWPSPLSNSKGDVKGLGLMARVGFHINEVLFVAADARYGQPKFKDSSNNYDATAVDWNLGPTVGVQMPVVGLRVWGTYVATSQLNPKESNMIDLKFPNGRGYRIGAGFKVFMVSLNLEYQKLDYDKIEIEKLGPLTPGMSDVKASTDGLIASVSFPLSI